MGYLMHIGFDNSARLSRNTYYLEYKGVQFKLLQHRNAKRYSDILLTKVDDHGSSNAENAYAVASEFLSALSWEDKSRISMWYSGGPSFRDEWSLRRARRTMYSWPRTPYMGGTAGHNLVSIPHIETPEQRTALILFREANASNSDYLAFHFYWQILDIGREEGREKAIDWVTKTHKTHRQQIEFWSRGYLRQLNVSGKEMGKYLWDDCRCAIAHIRRTQGRRQLKLDSAEDSYRISLSTGVVKAFAKFYIENDLKLCAKMWCVKEYGKGFPVFVSEGDLKKGSYSIAYDPIPRQLPPIEQDT